MLSMLLISLMRLTLGFWMLDVRRESSRPRSAPSTAY